MVKSISFVILFFCFHYAFSQLIDNGYSFSGNLGVNQRNGSFNSNAYNETTVIILPDYGKFYKQNLMRGSFGGIIYTNINSSSSLEYTLGEYLRQYKPLKVIYSDNFGYFFQESLSAHWIITSHSFDFQLSFKPGIYFCLSDKFVLEIVYGESYFSYTLPPYKAYAYGINLYPSSLGFGLRYFLTPRVSSNRVNENKNLRNRHSNN